MQIFYLIDKLIVYALNRRLIGIYDIPYIRNQYYDLLELFPSKELEYSTNNLDQHVHDEYPDHIIDELYDCIVSKTNIKLGDNSDIVKTRLLNIITPIPSVIVSTFQHSCLNSIPSAGIEYLYNTNIACGYIKLVLSKQNIHWENKNDYGKFLITINVIKPEKDPKQIAALINQKVTSYPKCALCLENEGFAGNATSPSKFNLRLVPLTLNCEKWYFQFSPYMYYDRHAIIFSHNHRNMLIDNNTFQALFDFVNFLPEYIIGANADLPIVGGSILNHDHFQAGKYIFPIEMALNMHQIIWQAYPDVNAHILHWPVSTIKLVGSQDSLLKLARTILLSWLNYNDPELNIISHTGKIRHNTLNPILRKIENNQYQLYLILRNNKTSPSYPDGIFHVHPQHHHIKKENIGLIEAMGLAILPSRLKQDLLSITNAIKIDNLLDVPPIHQDWVANLNNQYNPEQYSNIEHYVQHKIGEKFVAILECCGVFKKHSQSILHWTKFIATTDGRVVNNG